MAQDIKVKICGLREPQHVRAAVAGGAGYLGFVFYQKSPRNLSIKQARDLAVEVPIGVAKVALTVDADNVALDAIMDMVPLDMLQLHGTETTARVTEVRKRYGLPVMKAVGVATSDDLAALDEYAGVADQLLVDAKPAKGAKLPGGNGLAFDWRMIANRRWSVPWMLAGGLTPDNVAMAVQMTGATQVDVSSGVESGAGLKHSDLIARFCAAAKGDAR